MYFNGQVKMHNLQKFRFARSNHLYFIDASRRFFHCFFRKNRLFSVFLYGKCLFWTCEKAWLFLKKVSWISWAPTSEKSGLHSSMQFDILFRTVKTTGLDIIPIKNHSRNTHASSILNWIVTVNINS
jgi:hypothetical protein